MHRMPFNVSIKLRGDGHIDDICLVVDRNMNISNLTPIESDKLYEQTCIYIYVNVGGLMS